MVSSDDVTITEHEDGSMSITDEVGMCVLFAHEVAALRAHFAAELERDGNAPTDSGVELERMPEDVQALVEDLQNIGCYEGGPFYPWMREVANLAAAALEAAYSKGADDDSR